MYLGMTVWGDRVSPVFEAAQSVLLFKLDGNTLGQKHLQSFSVSSCFEIHELLDQHQVQVVICGAICRRSRLQLELTGVRVIGFISGKVEQILDRYMQDRDVSSFIMPGCRANRCHSVRCTSDFFR